MSSLKTCVSAALTALVLGAAATPSCASAETFGGFHQLTTLKGVHWIRTQIGAANSFAREVGGRLFTKNAGTAAIGDAAGELPVSFSYFDPTLAAALNQGSGLQAGFRLDATVTPSTSGVFTDVNGDLEADNLNGSFDFIYRGFTPITDGFSTVTNGGSLLHAVFTNATLTGKPGGSTISFVNSTAGGISHISFTSPFLDFSSITDVDFVLGLGSIRAPGIGTGPSVACTTGVGPCAKTFNSFDAMASGNLDAAAPSAVPEPASWALMLAGFGTLGMVFRRRARLKPEIA